MQQLTLCDQTGRAVSWRTKGPSGTGDVACVTSEFEPHELSEQLPDISATYLHKRVGAQRRSLRAPTIHHRGAATPHIWYTPSSRRATEPPQV